MHSGFDTSFRPRYPIISNGVNLQDLWKDYPVDSYLSIAVQGFPNVGSAFRVCAQVDDTELKLLLLSLQYFTYYGPYGPAGECRIPVRASSTSPTVRAVAHR